MLLLFFVYTLEHTQGLKTASDISTTMVSPMLESKFFGTSNKTKTHYLQTGDSNGQLIICLHGLGGSVSTFKPLVPSLPKKYNIVLMDFQGFGQTPLTSNTEPLSFSGHVSDVHDLITFLQRDNNGNAKGGKVCITKRSRGAFTVTDQDISNSRSSSLATRSAALSHSTTLRSTHPTSLGSPSSALVDPQLTYQQCANACST